MRPFYLLTTLALLLAAVSAGLLWQAFRPSAPDENGVTAEVARIKGAFTARARRLQEIPLEQLRQARKSPELSDPAKALPQVAAYPRGELARLARYADTCDGAPLALRSAALRKALLWHRFLCGRLRALPAGFFEAGFLMHPSGSSYAQLAASSGRREFSGAGWAAAHEGAFHLLEVIRPKLTAWDLRNMLAGEEVIVKPEHVLLAAPVASPIKATTAYGVYSRAEWDRFVASRPLVATARIDSPACLLREGNVCWIQNPGRQAARNRIALALLLAGFVALSAGTAGAIVRRARAQKREAEQRLFTLQLLTHELRTPATAIRLLLETQRREFDHLPAESQKAFLMICGELQRLERVVEASKRYLRVQGGGPALLSAASPVAVNDFVASVLEPYSAARVAFRPLPDERELSLDRHWAELCIRNLVENALAHGAPPVTVALAHESGALTISIADEGSVAFRTLDEMAVPFRKSSASRGLGLGLSIVQKVVEAMDGELLFSPSPTRFSIRLRQTS